MSLLLAAVVNGLDVGVFRALPAPFDTIHDQIWRFTWTAGLLGRLGTFAFWQNAERI